VGRALWLGAKAHPIASDAQKQALLQAAVAGVSGGHGALEGSRPMGLSPPPLPERPVQRGPAIAKGHADFVQRIRLRGNRPRRPSAALPSCQPQTHLGAPRTPRRLRRPPPPPPGALPVAAKVGACRALTDLAPAVPKPALQPLLPGAYTGLLQLLLVSSEETAHLVLGTLAALVQVGRAGGGCAWRCARGCRRCAAPAPKYIKRIRRMPLACFLMLCPPSPFNPVLPPGPQVDTEVASQHVMQLAGPVLDVWSANVADPLVAGEGARQAGGLDAGAGSHPPLQPHHAPHAPSP
jgi:hypothetical protein